MPKPRRADRLAHYDFLNGLEPVLGTETTEVAGLMPRQIKLAWGTGALGVALMMNSIGGFILFYMVSVLKIEPALAGSLIFIAKLAGVVTDPMVGTWSDRLNTQASRRRPFLVFGAITCSAAYVMIFTTPLFSAELLRAGWVFTALLLYTAGYSLFNVPYMSMPAEMTDDYHERTSSTACG